MRPALFVAAILALAALVPPSSAFSLLASCASVLVEALPWIALERIAPFLGCGCGRAGARAVPVAILAWVAFGPAVAIARFAAALVVAKTIVREHDHRPRSAIEELYALLPSAALASVILHVASGSAMPQNPVVQLVMGAAMGFVGAPCALGGIALAASLHTHAPIACAAVLCISGVIDARTLLRLRDRPLGENGFAEGALALVCAIVAFRHGAQLVHPLLTAPLGVASVVFAWRAGQRRWRPPNRECIVPAIVMTALIIGAPVPDYRATETTLAEAFPGERVRFTGILVKSEDGAALVRYAITCCRADAQPVVLRLASTPAFPARTWLSVDGSLVRRRERLALEPGSITAVAPPNDPFVYR
jgi:hypothetical protein